MLCLMLINLIYERYSFSGKHITCTARIILLFGSRTFRHHNLDVTKLIKFYLFYVSGFFEENVIEIGKKIKFYFYFSPPTEVHYMWALILNENDVNSTGVAFIMDWHPLYCL
jgi:CRISPR/Cas system endoribonuclease Cas6 (RAMP superfamily)